MRLVITIAVVTLGVVLCAACAPEPEGAPLAVVTEGGERGSGDPPVLVEVDESALLTAPGVGAVAQRLAQGMSSLEAAPAACASEVAGLEAIATTNGGRAALVLRTSRADQVDLLRRRARELAIALDAERRDRTCAIDPVTGAPARISGGFATTGAMHDAREVRLHDVPDGVRLELFPRRGATDALQELGAELREDARALNEGRCPLRFQTT